MSFSESGGVITQSNETGKIITAIADGGSNELDLSVAAHSYSAGDLLEVTGTTSYNGVYLVASSVDVNTVAIFDTTVDGIQNTFGSTETGNVARGDKDFSSLSGVTGVTTETSGEVTIYDIGTKYIVFNGAQLAGNSGIFEQLIIREPANHNNHKVEVNGFLQLGSIESDVIAYRKNYGIPIIKEDAITTGDQQPWSNGGAGNAGTLTAFWTDSGGSLRVFGQTLAISGSFSVHVSASVKIEDSMIYAYHFYIYSVDADLLRSKFYSKAGNWSLVTTFNTFDQIGGTMATNTYLGGSSTTPTGTIPINNVPELLTGQSILGGGRTSASPAVLIDFYDCFAGSDYTFVSTSGRYITADLSSRFTVDVKSLSGTPLTAKTHYVGTSGTDSTTSHTGLSSEQTFKLRSVVQAGGTSLSSDTRYDKDQDGTDLIDITTYAYGYVIASRPNVSLKGNNTKAFEQSASVDFLITETTKATVDAYTTLDNAIELYDRSCSFLFDNFAGETETLMTRAGSEINIGTYNLDIDATAGSAFAFDGTKFTIKSSEFIGNITTTGTVTLLNGAIVTGIVDDSTGTTDLLKVENLVGAYISLQDNTGTGIDYQTAVTGTYNYAIPAGSTGTWIVCLRRQGYAPRKITFPINGTIHTLDGTLIKRTNFDGTDAYTGTTDSLVTVHIDDPTTSEARIDIGNGQVPAQIAYNMAEDALITSAGICTDIDQVLQIDPLGFQLYSLSSNIKLRRELVGDVSAGVQGIVSHEDGVPVDETNGGVRIYSAPTFLTQQDIRDSMALDLTVGTSVIAGSVDDKADTIQAKTDQLIFTSGNVNANTKAISGSTISADNLELQYDGTGLTGVSFPSTQGQVSNISVTGSAVNAISESYVLTTGTLDSGTYDDTHALDGVRHEHSDSGGVIDLYYEFDIGSTGIPTGCKVVGAITGNNDQIGVFAYNWITTDWNQVGSMTGSASSENSTFSYDLLTAHVGTGANVGTTRIRFYEPSGLTNATLYIDQLLVSETINPTGIANGSTVTLTENISNSNLVGNGWKLDLNGQIIAGTYIYGAVLVTGTGVSENNNGWVFEDCNIRTATLSARGYMARCAISDQDTIILTSTSGVETDEVNFVDCVSGVAGTDVPAIDASGVTKTTSISTRRWSGGLKITSNAFCTTSVDVVSGGNIKIYGTGGLVAIRGTCTVQDFSGGAVTIVDTSVINRNTIAEAAKNILDQGLAQGSGSGTAQIQLASTASSQNGAYDPSIVYISSGTGMGQSRMILEYDGSTKIAAVDRSWKVLPDTTSEYIVEAAINSNSLNEGIVQSATANTVTLNPLACSDDSCYSGQMVWLRGGTGEDQTSLILSYNGTTKVATLERAWTQIPDNTTSYMIIPASPVLLAQTTHTGAIIPNVTLVDTTTTNTDMVDVSGVSTFDPSTDEVTTDTASREASKATGFAKPTDVTDSEAVITTAIGNLQDISAADVQAELVAYGANKIAPDNAGINANGVAISNLNDVSTVEVKAQADQALVDYDSPTKSELDSAVAPLATEANATTNKDEVVAEVNENETKIDNIGTQTTNSDAILSNMKRVDESTGVVVGTVLNVTKGV